MYGSNVKCTNRSASAIRKNHLKAFEWFAVSTNCAIGIVICRVKEEKDKWLDWCVYKVVKIKKYVFIWWMKKKIILEWVEWVKYGGLF